MWQNSCGYRSEWIGTFGVFIPLFDAGTSFTPLPLGTTFEISLPQGVAGDSTTNKSNAPNDALEGTAIINFIGNIIDVILESGADCSLGCKVSFDFSLEDADLVDVDPFEVKILHDKNNNGNFNDLEDVLEDTVVTEIVPGLFRAESQIDSTSKFAVGGIVTIRPFLALGGAGSLGFNPPIVTSGSLSTFGIESGGVKEIAEEGGFDSIDGPITIATGENLELRFDVFENKGKANIEHVTLYTDLRGENVITDEKDTFIRYEKFPSEKLTLNDPNELFSKLSFHIEEKDATHLVLKYNLEFAKSMNTSDIVLHLWDLDRFSSKIEFDGLISL